MNKKIATIMHDFEYCKHRVATKKSTSPLPVYLHNFEASW